MSDEPTPCMDHPGVDYLFGDLTSETLARLRAEAQADIQREHRGGDRRPKADGP